MFKNTANLRTVLVPKLTLFLDTVNLEMSSVLKLREFQNIVNLGTRSVPELTGVPGILLIFKHAAAQNTETNRKHAHNDCNLYAHKITMNFSFPFTQIVGFFTIHFSVRLSDRSLYREEQKNHQKSSPVELEPRTSRSSL